MVPIKMRVRMGCPACGWSGYRKDLITTEALDNPDQVGSKKPCPKCGERPRVLYLLVPEADD